MRLATPASLDREWRPREQWRRAYPAPPVLLDGRGDSIRVRFNDADLDRPPIARRRPNAGIVRAIAAEHDLNRVPFWRQLVGIEAAAHSRSVRREGAARCAAARGGGTPEPGEH